MVLMKKTIAMRNKGFVHVYTGEGKGKTTAAIGLAVRTAGAGLDVFFAQFLKGRQTSELAILKRLSDRIIVRRFGGCGFIRNGGNEFDISEVEKGMQAAYEAIASGLYSLVILDEINLAVFTGLLEVGDVLTLLNARPEKTTIVLTGRYAPKEIIDSADLVTDMKEIKHYFHDGFPARLGIEM